MRASTKKSSSTAPKTARGLIFPFDLASFVDKNRGRLCPYPTLSNRTNNILDLKY
jgi:hypothetical protein